MLISIMNQQTDHKIATIRAQVQRGEYSVDPAAVAAAILKRIRQQ